MTGEHAEHLVPEGGDHETVDQEVGGGVDGEEDVRHEAQGDAPHREPAQVRVTAPTMSLLVKLHLCKSLNIKPYNLIHEFLADQRIIITLFPITDS